MEVVDEQGSETEFGRVIRAAVETYIWTCGAPGLDGTMESATGALDEHGDGDDWEGFYLSLELEGAVEADDD